MVMEKPEKNLVVQIPGRSNLRFFNKKNFVCFPSCLKGTFGDALLK